MAKRKIPGIAVIMFLILALAPSLPAQQTANDIDWSPLKFLLGDWVGVGDGGPGQGSGGTSFNFDLQNKILVRKNWADYAATKDRPAASHNDLMIVYPSASRKEFEADYFDNEGHVIHYTVVSSPDSKGLTMTSEPSSSMPGYRLIYTQIDENNLALRFDIAPPGKPFAKYIEAKLRRK